MTAHRLWSGWMMPPADDCRAERKALGHEPMRMGWSAYE